LNQAEYDLFPVKYFKGIFLLLLISLVLSFSYNYLSPSGIALIGNWDKTKGVISANEKGSVVVRDREVNSVNKMKNIVDDNTFLVIDVRPSGIFQKGHIPRAKSIPISEFEELIGNFYESVTMEQKIIVYCSGRECTDSHIFANMLTEFGYENVQVFAGGFGDWEQSGFKIEKN
jgi:rhodanese-related sulfurtransferase